MKFLKQHIIFRFFTIILALQILNCSVDIPFIKPDFISESLTINKMESIVEIVLEKILCIDNAIAEQDEQATDNIDHSTIEKELDLFYQNPLTSISKFAYGLETLTLTLYKEHYFSNFHPEICPPPPKG